MPVYTIAPNQTMMINVGHFEKPVLNTSKDWSLNDWINNQRHKTYAINRSIVGFDTFEGFTSINKDEDPADINENMFSDTDQSLIQDMIDANDLLRPVNRIPRCELVKGDICKTVPEFVKSRPDLVVAMLILDTDLYEPTKVALETFLPYMPKGAIVVLDEVAYRNFPGETKALREVFDMNKIELKRLPFDSCVGYFHI